MPAVVGLGLVAALALSAPENAQNPAPAPLQAIPVDLRATIAPTPVVAEGQRHLVYELRVDNLGAQVLDLRAVEALDAASGAVLARYDDKALDAIIARPGAGKLADRRAIAGGTGAVLFLDIVTPTTATAPGALIHRLTFAPVTPANAPGPQSTVTGGRVEVARARPVILGPPVHGDHWLASHALSNDSSHRRSLIAVDGAARISQRFAVDWTRIGPDGQVFRGDPADNAHWTPWNADVLAVADGVVVETVDGIPENNPVADDKAVPITVDNATGDHVVLAIGGGRFVTYAHLRPGSLKVRSGQRVRRGQVIANLGNSGKSDAPHLHLQVTDGLKPLASEGLPFVFDRFTLEGHLASLSMLVDGTGWRPTEPAQDRRGETPVRNAVVAFPDR